MTDDELTRRLKISALQGRRAGLTREQIDAAVSAGVRTADREVMAPVSDRMPSRLALARRSP